MHEHEFYSSTARKTFAWTSYSRIWTEHHQYEKADLDPNQKVFFFRNTGLMCNKSTLLFRQQARRLRPDDSLMQPNREQCLNRLFSEDSQILSNNFLERNHIIFRFAY
jgi:hypothetical protein